MQITKSNFHYVIINDNNNQLKLKKKHKTE
jgi:hypothetical protein